MTGAAGPYICRHVEPAIIDGIDETRVLSVKAVADLDEAQEFAQGIVSNRWPVVLAGSRQASAEIQRGWGKAYLAACVVNAEAPLDTVSLPDGSEIHVEATNWIKLRGETGMYGRYSTADVIAEWNRRFGVSQEKGGER